MAITDLRRLPATELVARVEQLCAEAAPGTVVVQVRDRELETRRRLQLCEELARTTVRRGQLLSVNDRIDLCLLVQAHALHLGEDSVSVTDARHLVGPRCWISVACHDPQAVAELEADAIVLSPILEPRKGNAALGLEGLRQAREILARKPRPPLLFALGGIGAEGAALCLAAGADGVAAIGSVFGHPDPRSLLESLGICRA